MRCPWGFWFVFLIAVVGTGGGLFAQEKSPKAAPAAPAGADEFKVEQVIHPVVRAMPPPEFHDEIVAMPMAISSRSELAQRHVVQGLACIQSAWDFEAYRHLCEAVKLDPDCLMAYWGIGLALAAPNNEFSHERMMAIDRMLVLMDATVMVGGEAVPVATPMEREYALALATLFALRGNDAAKAFQDLADNYPNNLQARCLAIYLKRDGYDDFGAPLFGQEVAIDKMQEVLEKNPDNLTVLNFWAMLHAEAPDGAGHLRNEILPVVRKITRKAPDFPPYQHLLGHFEWRCGNHQLAEEAFSRASALYEAHMKKNKQSFFECDGWLRCQLYLATALHSRGKFDEAMVIASKLGAVKVIEERLGSAGANLVLWEARTLMARFYAARGAQGDLDRAIASLPQKQDPQLFVGKTLSIFYLEGLRQYLSVRRFLEAGDQIQAQEWREALDKTIEEMMKLQPNAMRSSSISEYVRAVSALEVYAAEARGRVALAGGDGQHGIAKSWFMSAAEKQQRPSLLMPPVVVAPMELRLAEFYKNTKDPKKAAEAYQDALKRCPNDLASLEGYRAALVELKRPEVADQVEKLIRQMTLP